MICYNANTKRLYVQTITVPILGEIRKHITAGHEFTYNRLYPFGGILMGIVDRTISEAIETRGFFK